MRKSIIVLLIVFLVGAIAATWGTGTKETPSTSTLKAVKLIYDLPSNTWNDDARAAVQEAINKYLTSKINAQLNLNLIDWGTWSTKYPVILASGEQADLMFSASWSGYTTEAAKGAFLQLNDLLKQYGQGILSTIQDGFIKAATIKGKLFAVPENKDAAQGYAFFAQKSILDKAGVKVQDIKSLDDLTPVLAYVKANEPGLIPMSTVHWANTGMYMCTKAGFADGVGDYSKLEIGYDQWRGIVVFDKTKDQFTALDPSVSQAWPAYAKLMNGWATNGYFPSDIMTRTTDDSASLIQQGKTWITDSSDVPGQLELLKGQTGKDDLVMIPVIPSICNTDSMTGSLTTIPISSVDPARAMMVINLLHTDKYLLNLLNNGIEGKNYVKTGANTIKLPEGFKAQADTGWSPGWWWMVGNAFLNYIWDTDLPNRWDAIKAYNDKAPRSPILGFSFDSTNVKSEIAAVNNIYGQYEPLIAIGSGDTVGYVNTMFNNMKASGLDKIIAEYNREYKEYKAAQ